MRNAVALCVRQNRLDAIGRQFKLFGDFGDAHAIVEVIDNRVGWHPCAVQHGSAALHSRLDFRLTGTPTSRFYLGSHGDLPAIMIPWFRSK